jgi:hypothetical protein
MLIRIFIIFIVTMTVLFSCDRSKREKEPTSSLLTKEEETGLRRKEDLQKDQLEEEYNLDFSAEDIGVIQEFTPEIFVKLTILYKNESKKWIKEAQSLPPEKQTEYIEKANRSFFAQFGSREEAYIDYSQKNIDELNAYMSEHPEYFSQLNEY